MLQTMLKLKDSFLSIITVVVSFSIPKVGVLGFKEGPNITVLENIGDIDCEIKV